MASTTVITAAHLAAAHVPSELAALCLGKTVAEMSESLDVVYSLALANGISAGGLIRYNLDGQSGEVNFEDLIRIRAALRSMSRTTAGPVFLPVEFGCA